jgi:hypothetical protein
MTEFPAGVALYVFLPKKIRRVVCELLLCRHLPRLFHPSLNPTRTLDLAAKLSAPRLALRSCLLLSETRLFSFLWPPVAISFFNARSVEKSFSVFQLTGIRYHSVRNNFDAFVKSPKSPFFVIPAKAGIQCFHRVTKSWTPFFNGVTTFYEFINFPS